MHYEGHVFTRSSHQEKFGPIDGFSGAFARLTTRCFLLIFSRNAQDIIDKSGFLGTLVGTTFNAYGMRWGTLIDKIDRLIRGHKISWEKRETFQNHTTGERGFFSP